MFFAILYVEPVIHDAPSRPVRFCKFCSSTTLGRPVNKSDSCVTRVGSSKPPHPSIIYCIIGKKRQSQSVYIFKFDLNEGCHRCRRSQNVFPNAFRRIHSHKSLYLLRTWPCTTTHRIKKKKLNLSIRQYMLLLMEEILHPQKIMNRMRHQILDRHEHTWTHDEEGEKKTHHT